MSLRICPDHLWVCDRSTELGTDETCFYPAYRYTAENRVLKFAAPGRQHLHTFQEATQTFPQDQEAIERVREFVRSVTQAERFLYEPHAEPSTGETLWEHIQDED